MRKFSSGLLGPIVTGSPKWTLSLAAEGVRFDKGAVVAWQDLAAVEVEEGMVWHTMRFRLRGGEVRRIEAVRSDADKIRRIVADEMSAMLIVSFERIVAGLPPLQLLTSQLLAQQRYLADYDVRQWECAPPLDGLCAVLAHPMFDRRAFEEGASSSAREAAVALAGLRTRVDEHNARFVAGELDRYTGFFDSVEKMPLTDEQRDACVVMQDRNLLVAAAGSGKTSVIVGKVGYAIDRGYAKPEEILVVAFNNFAVKEIEERVNARLSNLLEGKTIRVQTFHALGQSIIAQTERRKPSVGSHAAGGEIESFAMFSTIVEELTRTDAQFAEDWIEFTTMYLKPAAHPAEFKDPEDWQDHVRRTGTVREDGAGFMTLNGELVKSRGELAIANWLFMRGVPYQYEKAYAYITADEEHRQYRPDFYLPEINCYLEHYALDAHGNPPVVFGDKYREGVIWKRALHAEKGTGCIETTFAQFVSGTLFPQLEAQLRARGQDMDVRPGDAAKSRIADYLKAELGQFMTGFIPMFVQHARSNRIGSQALLDRAADNTNPYRATLFAGIAADIIKRYETVLRERQEIDFEDMILRAEDAVRSGRFLHPYKLVLVDEFQDISQSRARLVKALLDTRPECKLFCVGDDWQAIYRFAGADISIFHRFALTFGVTATRKLSTTFRSCQGIADVAGSYVAYDGNPLGKHVRAADDTRAGTVVVSMYARREEAAGKLLDALRRMQKEAAAAGSRRSVFVLARYKAVLAQIPDLTPFKAHLDIDARTIHRAKGLEADYVILLGLQEGGAYSFPALLTDDPLLHLVMPEPEPYAQAEERRLMYVALTRAKRRAVLVARQSNPSVFVAELLRSPQMKSVVEVWPPAGAGDSTGEPSAGACPVCRTGYMVRRRGAKGEFLGCSAYPSCKATAPAGLAGGKDVTRPTRAVRAHPAKV